MRRESFIENLPFSLRELRCLIAVAEEGQLTSAAARLRVAQPAVSRSLAGLELRVGAPLLVRHARGVTLTAAGRALYEKAGAVVAAAEEAVSAVGPWARGERRLLLGLPGGAHALARPLRQELAERRPEIDLTVVELEPGERLSRLRGGRVDVELAYPPPREPDLLTRTVLRSPRYAVLSEEHPLALAPRVELEVLATELLSCTPDQAAAQLRADGWMARRKDVARSSELGAALALDELWPMICAGRAAAVLPRFMLASVVGDGVRAVPLADVEAVEVVLVRRAQDERETVAALLELAAGSGTRDGAGRIAA